MININIKVITSAIIIIIITFARRARTDLKCHFQNGLVMYDVLRQIHSLRVEGAAVGDVLPLYSQ